MARGYPCPKSGKPPIALQDLWQQRGATPRKRVALEPGDPDELEALDRAGPFGEVDAEHADRLAAAHDCALDLAEARVAPGVRRDAELLVQLPAGGLFEGLVPAGKAAGEVPLAPAV